MAVAETCTPNHSRSPWMRWWPQRGCSWPGGRSAGGCPHHVVAACVCEVRRSGAGDPAVPAQQGLRVDRKQDRGIWRHAADRGERGAVDRLSASVGNLSVRRGALMAHDQELELLGGVAAGEERAAGYSSTGSGRQAWEHARTDSEAAVRQAHDPASILRIHSSQAVSQLTHPAGGASREGGTGRDLQRLAAGSPPWSTNVVPGGSGAVTAGAPAPAPARQPGCGWPRRACRRCGWRAFSPSPG